jgi:hypothetical protein
MARDHVALYNRILERASVVGHLPATRGRVSA